MAFLREIRPNYWALLESYREGAIVRKRCLKTWSQPHRPTPDQVEGATSTKVSPITNYVGSKWRLSAVPGGIADILMGYQWGRYLEPFCGSCAAWATLHNRGIFDGGRTARLNDASSEIGNLYGVVARPGTRRILQQQLERIPYCQSTLKEAITSPDDDAIARAAKFLVRSHLSRSPEKEGRCAGSGYAAGESRKAVWDALPARLVPFGRALRSSAEIYQSDALRWIPAQARAAKGDCAIYCDPPYVSTEGLYSEGKGWTPDTHRRLAKILGEVPAAVVVVSYYPHPLVAQLYPRDRWEHRQFTMQATARGAGHSAATELLLIRRNASV